ncbi:MAG: hypothetical protein RLY64_1241 [Bacteroidota bacterium]|jgi:uncharacterized protein (TIGR02145 family)
MKTILTLLLAALALAIGAQPQKINYQAIALGSNGKPLKNTAVSLRLSVLDSAATGTVLYTETQPATTDAGGQFSVYLGTGTPTAGTFASLPWANGNDKFLKVEMDAQGGTNYQTMGTTQLVSVPYAMTAGSLREGALLYGNGGQIYQLNIGVNGPVWTCYPPTIQANAGPDQLSLTGTTANLAANTPAAGQTGTWTITIGSGATLNYANSPTATFTKGTDSSYTLVWTITGPCGTSRDTVNLLFPAPVGTACGNAVTYAGESYPTVQIGTQCWFAKNLNVGTMINSSASVDSQRNNGVIEKYCYSNNPGNCTTYGGLYQWAEALQYQNGASNSTSPNPAFTGNVRGICPTGWHMPSDAEWGTLETFLGGSSVAGGALKSTSGLWKSPNTGATNSSGFSALPGGVQFANGSSIGIRLDADFWTSSESSSTNAIYRYLLYYNSNIFRSPNSTKNYGFSARCTQD